jgi:hypothetical protein
MEDYSLSAVLDCLFNIFAATLHTWRPDKQPKRKGKRYSELQIMKCSFVLNTSGRLSRVLTNKDKTFLPKSLRHFMEPNLENYKIKLTLYSDT